MVEVVNASHPDKMADRIAGAIVDLGYKKQDNPKIACEVLIGHGYCHIIIETNVDYATKDIAEIVRRIAGDVNLDLNVVPQDKHLANNQATEIRCGDNGIFKGCPMTLEQEELRMLADNIYNNFHSDGKYILNQEENKLIICQSNAKTEDLEEYLKGVPYKKIINPLGEWTGGTETDCGATNRKLGSDMFDAVTGGGLHGKDCSKADVSVNIYCHIKAQELECNVYGDCAIGDTEVNFKDEYGNKWKEQYSEIVEKAKDYIDKMGGFEKLAEWGLQ